MTRERIVASATALMCRNGVRNTSLDEIGADAGVGKSQIYHYFADKSALVNAVIAQQTENILEGQRPYLAALSSWAGWQAWRDAIVGYQYQTNFTGGCPLGSLAGELAEIDELARQDLMAGFARWKDCFADGLSAMQASGKLLAASDVDALALNVLSATQGGLLLCQTFRDVRPLEVALDAAIANLRLWSAVGKRA